jgi:hypothetical protein
MLNARMVTAQVPFEEFPLAVGTQVHASWNPEHATIVERL